MKSGSGGRQRRRRRRGKEGEEEEERGEFGAVRGIDFQRVRSVRGGRRPSL